MSVAFSSGDCMERRIEFSSDEQRYVYIAQCLDSYFEIERIAVWVRDRNFNRIALQFPDDLLRFSVQISTILAERLGNDENVRFYVLGDTSYGSCCVDEVAAEHGIAQAIVHFGPSCLSPPPSLPVLFIFGKEQSDVDDLIANCVSSFSPTDLLLFLFDPLYSHCEESVAQKLFEIWKEKAVVSRCVVPGDGVEESSQNGTCNSQMEFCRRQFILPEGHKLEDFKIIYIGSEGPSLNNLMLHFQNEFYTYDPRLLRLRRETVSVNKSFLKRYVLIEKAKDANIIGILAGTLGVANYREIIKRLKTLINAAGKKSYTFVVGKINVPKLANFQEIDLFVLVACPENSLIDSREFYQPVLTPYELEVALNANREWEPKLVTDFRQLLPGQKEFVELDENPEETNDISLITGQMRTIGRGSSDCNGTAGAIVKRDDGTFAVSSNTGAGFLHSRSWKGLEQNLGQTDVVKAVEGEKGIAMGYEKGDGDKK